MTIDQEPSKSLSQDEGPAALTQNDQNLRRSLGEVELAPDFTVTYTRLDKVCWKVMSGGFCYFEIVKTFALQNLTSIR